MIKSKSFLRPGIGILLGLLLSIISGFIYLQVLHAPGSLFYIFAVLAFFLGPVVAGIVDTKISPSHPYRRFLASGGVVFGIIFVLFFLIYAILIRFFTTSVYLPAYCDRTYNQSNIPSNLEYSLPDKEKGILINADDSIAVVATIDYDHSAHSSTLFIINKATGNILFRINFPDDNLAAAIDNSTVYLFNNGLGFFVDKLTGKRENYFLTMDEYGTNTLGYFETTGIISSWNKNGSVKSLPHLSFNGIVQGCYVSAVTKEVIKLK
jgi:hypothetical protein